MALDFGISAVVGDPAMFSSFWVIKLEIACTLILSQNRSFMSNANTPLV